MPLIRLETNASLPENKTTELSKRLAGAVAAVSGQPAQEFSVELAGGRRMRMATVGESGIVHLELRGLDFPKDRAKELTHALSPVLEDILGVREDQIYIAVISERNSMWRVNGATP